MGEGEGERGRGREREKERNINVIETLIASLHVPTRDRTHNPGICPEWKSDP